MKENPLPTKKEQYQFEWIYPLMLREDYLSGRTGRDGFRKRRAPRGVITAVLNYIVEKQIFPEYSGMYLSPKCYEQTELTGINLESIAEEESNWKFNAKKAIYRVHAPMSAVEVYSTESTMIKMEDCTLSRLSASVPMKVANCTLGSMEIFKASSIFESVIRNWVQIDCVGTTTFYKVDLIRASLYIECTNCQSLKDVCLIFDRCNIPPHMLDALKNKVKSGMQVYIDGVQLKV